MSSRNTGIFLRGHVSNDALAECLWAVGGLDSGHFRQDEAIRAGQGTLNGHEYTLITARLFAIAGFAMLDDAELPPAEDLEMVMGARLSARFGEVVFLAHDDEHGWGGYARFVDGKLTARRVVDGRGSRPVRREGNVESPLTGIDESEWVWPVLAQLVAEGAESILGEGVSTDDDIEARVVAAAVKPIPTPDTHRSAAPEASPSLARRALRRFMGKRRKR
jgi:hypothetical protein